MKTTSEIIAAAWKWHWAPLNNNQISWYKTQLHFSSSQRSWSACYILLTAGYLWFMDGVINKPFLNPNLLIEEHSPLYFLKIFPLKPFLFPLHFHNLDTFLQIFTLNEGWYFPWGEFMKYFLKWDLKWEWAILLWDVEYVSDVWLLAVFVQT